MLPVNPEFFKVNRDGQVDVPEKHGPMKVINIIKEMISVLNLPPVSSAETLLRDESSSMETKEKRLAAFSESEPAEEQLANVMGHEAPEDSILPVDPNRKDVAENLSRLSECKIQLKALLDAKSGLNSLSREELDASLISLRHQINYIVLAMAEEETVSATLKEKQHQVSTKWEYLCGRLAEEVTARAVDVCLTLPGDVQVCYMYSLLQDKHRIAEKWRQRVMNAQQHDDANDARLMAENNIPINGLILEYEDDLTDDVAQHVVDKVRTSCIWMIERENSD